MAVVTLTILEDVEQGSETWHAARRGILTASVVGKLLAFESPDAITVGCPKCSATSGTQCMSLARKTPTPVKTFHAERVAAAGDLPRELVVADNETTRKLTAALVGERIAGFTEPSSMTRDMERGVLMEPFARDVYSKHHAPAVEIGFMRVDEAWGTLGYSPDGLVGDDGLIEIKAPRTAGHLLTVLEGKVPDHYMPQCQAGLLVSGRQWLDFVPYVSGLPLWTIRVTPDPMWFAAIKAAVSRFEQTAAEMTDAYLSATANLPATERVDFYLDVI